MAINLLAIKKTGNQRIEFAQASTSLVKQALADSKERLVRHFPAVRWTTWCDMVRQLQLDILLEENTVTFDWQDLVGRIQRLAASPERPALESLMLGTATTQLLAYRQQAIQALAEQQQDPPEGGPLLHGLVAALDQENALPVANSIATIGAGSPTTNQPSLLARERSCALSNPIEEAVDALAVEQVEGTGSAGTLDLLAQPALPPQVLRPKRSRRRTFRAIVERHCRPNAKIGFTVRELCTTMHISAASLRHARANPGGLSVEKVMALAEAMGENPLSVVLDLLAEAGAKNKKRVPPRQLPEVNASNVNA